MLISGFRVRRGACHRAARRGEALGQPRHEELFRIKKSATGWLPSRPNFCNSLVQALRAPWCQA
jgi:hypothetical protein